MSQQRKCYLIFSSYCDDTGSLFFLELVLVLAIHCIYDNAFVLIFFLCSTMSDGAVFSVLATLFLSSCDWFLRACFANGFSMVRVTTTTTAI